MTPIAVMMAMNAKAPGNGAGAAPAHTSSTVSSTASSSASNFDPIFASLAGDHTPAAGTQSSSSTLAGVDSNNQPANTDAIAQGNDLLQSAGRTNPRGFSTAAAAIPDLKAPSSRTGAQAFNGHIIPANVPVPVSTPHIPLDVIFPAAPAPQMQVSAAAANNSQDGEPDDPVAPVSPGQAGGTNSTRTSTAANQVASGAAGSLDSKFPQLQSETSDSPGNGTGGGQADATGHQATSGAKLTDTNAAQAPDALTQLTDSLAKPGPNTFSPPTLALSAPAGAPNPHAANANPAGGTHGHPAPDASALAGNQQVAASQGASTTQPQASATNLPQSAVQTHTSQVAPSAATGAVNPSAPASLNSAPASITANLSVAPHSTEMHASQTSDLGTLAVTIAAKSLAGLKQFDIRLDPPELGRVDVRLSVDESGKAQAVLAADRPETLHLLKNDAPALERALKDSGLDLANNGLSFSLKGQDRQADSGANQSRNRSFAAKAQLTIEAVGQTTQIPMGHALEGAGLDIRV